MDLGGVCLVDADLSARRLTLAAGLGEQPGLRELLEGSASSMEDLIVHVPGSKLSFLPAGCLTDVPPLTEVRVQEIISELEDRFRYVFFDTPAIKRGVDAYRWGKYIGNAVLVVPAETSRRHSVVHAVNTMRLHGLHLLGVVLNRRVYPIPKWLYRFL
jgi:Mrp family chromosome partitioning ATPase